MNKTIALLLSLAFFGQVSKAQNLKCSDFKTGTFLLPKNDLVPFSFRIVRTDTRQTEQAFDVPDSLVNVVSTEIHYETIRWTGECSYVLIYDSGKMELDPFMVQTNAAGGLAVKINSIGQVCASYEAIGIVDGEKIVMTGKLCKEGG